MYYSQEQRIPHSYTHAMLHCYMQLLLQWCLASFANPHMQWLLILHNMYCSITRWAYFQLKPLFAVTSFKKLGEM